MGESLARHFTDTPDLSIIRLRLGNVTKENRPRAPRGFSVWRSHDDINQMVERCIDDPDTLRYDIFYALSNNRWGYRDLEYAREMVGYVPKDSAEDYRK